MLLFGVVDVVVVIAAAVVAVVFIVISFGVRISNDLSNQYESQYNKYTIANSISTINIYSSMACVFNVIGVCMEYLSLLHLQLLYRTRSMGQRLKFVKILPSDPALLMQIPAAKSAENVEVNYFCL